MFSNVKCGLHIWKTLWLGTILMYPKLKNGLYQQKGNKALPLEDLKSFSIDDKPETVDLIQENNLDRFEKEKKQTKNKGNFQIKQ